MKNQPKIKLSIIMRQTVLLLTLCLTVNCYSGAGDLHPQPGEDYTLIQTDDDRKAAQLVYDETNIQIYGSWSDGHFGNTFEVKNNSATPFSLDFTQVKLEIQEETIKPRILFITDLSNYDTAAFDDAKNAIKVYQYIGNDLDGKPLSVGSLTVNCAPKQKCIFSINVVFPGTKLNRDKSIKITLPALSSETKETEVIFNCSRNSI